MYQSLLILRLNHICRNYRPHALPTAHFSFLVAFQYMYHGNYTSDTMWPVVVSAQEGKYASRSLPDPPV